jgi:hypothetical protein
MSDDVQKVSQKIPVLIYAGWYKWAKQHKK